MTDIPEDDLSIPVDVLELSRIACSEADLSPTPKNMRPIARAIMAAQAEQREKDARIALRHSNYGHVEGNKRAFAIAAEIEKGMTTP